LEQKAFINKNKDGWDELIRSGKNFSNTSLPEYGPFMENEEKLQLFKDIKGKSILEFGCASCLEYLATKGASELWGLDFHRKINIASQKELLKNAKFIVIFQWIILIVFYLYIVLL